MSFRRRQVVYAALTANALQPLPGPELGLPSFVAGWLTGELAPHLLAGSSADAAVHLLRHRDRTGLALAGATAIGLGWLIRQSRADQQVAESALVEALGDHYAERLDTAPTPADLATPWRSLLNPFRHRNDGVRVVRNVPYGTEERNVLDLYLPATGAVEGAPVLLHVHGGGWMIGSKEQQGIPLMQHLAAKGWVCASINYRLAPRHAFPAMMTDIKRSIAWIHEHIAEHGGDPHYLAITGGSAGGHLSALAALTAGDPVWQPGFEEADTSVDVCIPHYGIYDWSGLTGTRAALAMRDRFVGRIVLQVPSFAADPEPYRRATPLLRITPDAPDFFVLHGARDTLAPVGQARLFVERLRAASSRPVVYAELPGAQHAFDVLPSIRSAHVVRAIDRYLHWHWHWHRSGELTGP